MTEVAREVAATPGEGFDHIQPNLSLMDLITWFEPEPSTRRQRHALYALGRSYSWVHRYCATKRAASLAIASALDDMRILRSTLHHEERLHGNESRDVDL